MINPTEKIKDITSNMDKFDTFEKDLNKCIKSALRTCDPATDLRAMAIKAIEAIRDMENENHRSKVRNIRVIADIAIDTERSIRDDRK